MLPAMAAGIIKPKTAALGMLSPAAAVVSAMSGKKRKDKVSAQPGGMSANYGG